MKDCLTKTVKLFDVTKEEAQNAIDHLDAIYDLHKIPEETRHLLWELHCVVASDVLIRFGEFDPEVGHAERNGHA